ncbi:MAG: HDIG domain-containing protein [Proteobacteria bacterium]|nr:HDIG domain-containing protein [Pseudomonadota bacterium]
MDEHRQRESLSFEKISRKKPRSKYLTWSLNNPLLVGAYIALVIVCSVLVIGGNVGSQPGTIDKADIGTIAAHDYKAPRDFTFKSVDRAATEKIRQERVSSVLPIYRWNTGYHEAVLARIHKAFEQMRDGADLEVERLKKTRAPRENESEFTQSSPERQAWADTLMQLFGGEKVFKDFVSTRELTEDEIASGLNTWSREHKSVFVNAVGYDLGDEAYQWLVSEQFSEFIEEGLLQEFDTVLGQMIVASRDSLDAVENFTIYDSNGKRDVSDKTKVTSQADAEERLTRLLKLRFPQIPESILDYFKQFVRPNLEFDETETHREKQNVSATTAELLILEEYKKGQTIVARGNPIEQKHYEVFEQVQRQGDYENRHGYWVALGIVVLILLFMSWRSILAETAKRQKMRDVVYMATSVLMYTALLRLSVLLCNVLGTVYHWPYSLLLIFPFACGPMLLRVVINRYYAYLFAVCSVVLTGLIVEDGMILTYAIVSSMAGCLLMVRPKRSNVIFKRGFLMGGISALMALGIYLLRGTNMTEADYCVVFLLGLGSGMLATGVLMIGLPVAESIFGYVTSNKLLELSNLEHPALKTLFLEAPGTYQHSIMVGSLNEAAAEAIGANAVLARVGGYYHDIGKVKNAQYFAENQRGDNPHNRLKPNMSALILKAHERDGLEIAKKYKLPQDIMDFIATHHGTSRIEYFYQRAKEQQERVHEEDYRYPGPRPQTRETGICMVSDSVEAAVRSLPDKSPDKILVLVRKLINSKFADGQFDECDLTLRDLNDIANALLGILNAFYHHRPEYPDQKKERERIEAEKREKLEAEKKAQEASNDKQDENGKSSSEKNEQAPELVNAAKKNDKAAEKTTDNKSASKNEKIDKEKEDRSIKDKSDKSDKTSKDKDDNREDKSLKDKSESKEDRPAKDKSEAKEDKSSKDRTETKEDKKEKAGKEDKSVKGKSDKADKSDMKDDKGANGKQDKSAGLEKSSDKNDKAAEEKADKERSSKENASVAKAERHSESVDDAQQSKAAAQDSTENADINSDRSSVVETEEANELLKESPEELADDAGVDKDAPSPAPIQDTYELTFSSQVDVFKKT